jgi:hypothetical protein
MDDPPVLVFSFVMTIAVIFSFLSNNPEMSFVTKDHFIWELLFSNRFTGAYLFKRKELDTDAIYTMPLVAIIIFFINYFSGNQNILLLTVIR